MRRTEMRWATLAASVAAISAILLLGLSGWFLTAAALAGASGVTAALAFNYLIPSAAIRLFALLRTGSRYGERLLSHRAALRAMADLRGTLFRKLAAQDGRAAPALSGGDASARLLGDIDALEDLVIRQPARVAALIAAATSIALVALAGWQAALALTVILAMLPLLLRMLAGRLTREPAQAAADALSELRTQFVEYAAARPEIAAYGLAERVSARLEGPGAALDTARKHLFVGEGVLAAIMLAYGVATVALVLALATGPAHYVALALLAAAAAVEAMAGLSRTALKRASVETALHRLDVIAKAAPPLPWPEAPAETITPARVRLGKTRLRPGARIAVIGESGSGKTILLETLAGLRNAALDITVDHLSPARHPATQLRAHFALAAQDALMLAGTIADNLRLARAGVTKADMWQALYIACLDTRIASAPAGLDTILGEAGGILSGGSASGWRWRARCWPGGRGCCSTSRPRASTRRPKPW
ncbi:ATP-binding cassette domain-containing protein [Sphingomonas sp.]|uniref:ATP-binding cassette domain-containing protein n=1 Tax=Sphingomonas sp. TaxID=28214 RepID=UPI00333E47A8